jgi:hypothetical protein
VCQRERPRRPELAPRVLRRRSGGSEVRVHAAKLNRANGSNFCIDATIASADAFLVSIKYVGPTGNYTLSSTQRATAISLKSALDTYNNGGGCS